MAEATFEKVPVEEWSVKNTEEWLKSCLNKYQLDDPNIHSKLKVKGKTLLPFHNHRELNKYFSQEHADILHGDLKRRLDNIKGNHSRPGHTTSRHSKKSPLPKPPCIPQWDKFVKQLNEIDAEFGQKIDKAYANELIMEALFSLKGNGNVIPNECLISRMVNTLYRQNTAHTRCNTPLQHLEQGHVKFLLPVDEAVGAFVRKLLLHEYPSLADLMLENILYLGQIAAVDTSYETKPYPPGVIVPNTSKRPKGSNDSGFDEMEDLPSPPFKPELDVLMERPEFSESISGANSPSWDDLQTERSQNSVLIDGNCFVVDLAADQIADEEKISFVYDQNLSIKFDVVAPGTDPKTITKKDSFVKVTIENNTHDDIGFSLRAYNLSSPGDIKVLHSQTGLTFQVLKGDIEAEFKGVKKRENVCEYTIEPIDLLMEPSGDYLMFELVICSLKNKENTWNILRNFMHIKYTSNNMDDLTMKELHELKYEQMGNEKRKKCIKILLDSLYHFIYNDLERAYWLTTQLLLLPDFQRAQFLVLCWSTIGTYLYESKSLGFEKQRKLTALINAINAIKKKLKTLQITILSNIVNFTDKSVNILQQYLDRQRLKKSISCPEYLAPNTLPIIVIEPCTSDLPVPSPTCKMTPLPRSISEPVLPKLSTKPLKKEENLLQYKTFRNASNNTENITFGDCIVACPPSRIGIEVEFGYAIMDSLAAQSTIVPGARHLATLRLENNLDRETYLQPFEIHFPKPRKVTKSMTIHVVYQDGVVTKDITDSIQTNFKSKTWSIMAPRNGTYVIVGLERLQEKVTTYVANDIITVKPLYVQLWFKSFGEYGKCGEVWCCISCKKDLLIVPPHPEAWPLGQLVLNTRRSNKIQFSLLSKHNSATTPNIPDMRYEFILTDTQGVFNFMHVLNLETTGCVIIFRINTQEDTLEREILIGTFL